MICQSKSLCRDLDVWSSSTDAGPTARASTNLTVAYRITPATPGFRAVGPAAFKLHTTIASLATNGGVVSATIEELAERSGLSDGTVGSALKELVDLAWLRLNATRGLGITVVLLTPPAKLAAAAQDRYMEKLKKRYNRWRKEAQRMAAVLAEDAGE